MCWGAKSIGIADAGQTAVPESFQKDAAVVAAGLEQTCATNTKGKLDCRGGNTFGQSSYRLAEARKMPMFLG